MDNIQYVWNDRKRYLGLPLSFTKYSLTKDRLFISTGLLNTKEEQLLLYRIRDISLTISLWQRIFGVGTVKLISSDKTSPEILLLNIKNPRNVSQLIHEQVEQMKKEKGMKVGEMLESSFIENDELEDID